MACSAWRSGGARRSERRRFRVFKNKLPFQMICLRAPLLVSVLALSGCAATRTYVDPGRHTPEITVSADDVEYEVFLLGNTGSGDVDDAAPVLRALARELRYASEESAVVFLGDQLDAGMPDSAAANRGEANRRLAMIAESVSAFDGRVFVLPGDHDWDGPESVRRQEDELERLLGRDNVFIPGDARSGPVVLELNDNIVLVGLDSAWWLEEEPKPIGDAGDVENDEGGYEIANPGDIIIAVEDILKEYDDENVLVVGHHPLRSNGPHGGQFSLGQHMLPLPVIGSAYPLYRQFAGTRQDLAHPRYRAYRTSLDTLFRVRDRVIYASSHEHSLQAFPFDAFVSFKQHYLISGSAARGEPVASGRGASLASSDRGFMRIRYMKDGSVWLDTFSVDPATGESTIIYHSRLYDRTLDRIEPDVPDIDPSTLPSYADSTVVLAVNEEFARGGLIQTLVGAGYRTAWATPTEFPVLDLGLHGGLTPIQKGGGLQTLSLRMRGGNGHQYVLRLLKKAAERNLAGFLRESIVANVMNELVSATIPWAALAIAELADDAGIYHTNPRLVLIPDDPRLGIYREEFGNSLALFEERPSGDMSDIASLGSSSNIISSAKMIAAVEGDNDHRVDQRFFLRSRLFDILIGDWDRHEDQWRWATFEPFELDPSLEGDARTNGKIYRPIPRDRDFALYRFDGLMPAIIRKLDRRLQSFHSDYGGLSGLTTSGISLDRRFTNELTHDDWIAIAEELRSSISDSDIHAAFSVWPPEIYQQYGAKAAEILMSRRDRLPEMAARVYRLNSRAVGVAGSDKHERFEITSSNDGSVEVVILKTNREGVVRREIYRRLFRPRETREIRLYGLGGRDQFVISGADNSVIKVRMIGGSGEDRVENSGRGNTTYYDTVDGNDVSQVGRTGLTLSDDPANNRYSPGDYQHPWNTTLITPGYNATDGLILGASFTARRPGFRRIPWAYTHFVSAAFSTGTSGFQGRFESRFHDAFGDEWDATIGLGGSTASYVNNFYGIGNETSSTSSTQSFFYAGIAGLKVEASAIRRVEQSLEFRFGGGGSYRMVDDDSTRFIGTPEAGLSADAFEGAYFANGYVSITLNAVDNAVNPRQGFRWTGRSDVFGGVNEPASTFLALGSDLTAYFSPSLHPQVTFAARAGVGHNIGTFPFYEAQSLGGTNFRSLRRQRYSGRTVAFQNVEARARVVESISSVLPLSIGVLGFLDNGRVWADDETSSTWHQGYGGGLWFSTLDLYVISATLGQGDDGLQFNFGLGFFF